MKNLDRSAMSVCAAIAVAAPHHAYAEEPSSGEKAAADSSTDASPRQLKSLRDLADECRIYIDAIIRKIKHPENEMTPHDAPNAFRQCSQELELLRRAIRNLYRALYSKITEAGLISDPHLFHEMQYWSSYSDNLPPFFHVPGGYELDSHSLQSHDVQPLFERLAGAQAFLFQLEAVETHNYTRQDLSQFCSERLPSILAILDGIEVYAETLESKYPKLLTVKEWDQSKRKVNHILAEERARVHKLFRCTNLEPRVLPWTTGDRGSSDNKKK